MSGPSAMNCKVGTHIVLGMGCPIWQSGLFGVSGVAAAHSWCSDMTVGRKCNGLNSCSLSLLVAAGREGLGWRSNGSRFAPELGAQRSASPSLLIVG